MKRFEPKLLAVMVACALGQVYAEGALAACDPNTDKACRVCEKDGQPAACEDHVRGKMVDNSATRLLPGLTVGPNTEQEPAPDGSRLTLQEKQIMRETAPPQKPVMEILTIQDTLKGGALFDSCEIDVLAEGRRLLDELVGRLEGKKNIRLQIVGHADMQRHKPECRALYHDNQGLSEARAFAVAELLKEKLGLAPQAITVAGKGDKQPVADNGTLEGMARNRRVDISLWYDDVKELPVTPPPPPKTVVVTTEPCGPQGKAAASDVPFRITVDGVPTDQGGTVKEPNNQRCVDVALEKGDIQIKYDALSEPQSLNGWVVPNGVRRGGDAEFLGYSNYAHWIKRAEIRLFAPGQNLQQTPFAVVPVQLGQAAKWKVPANAAPEYRFVLRVYDEQGRFDETAAKQLVIHTNAPLHDDKDKIERERLAGWGENSLQLRNIPVKGGVVSIYGDKFKPDQTVSAMGMVVPVGANGRFALRQILPAGPHVVDVAVANTDGRRAEYRRSLSIPDNDWFYVAIGDLTLGRNNTSGPAAVVTQDTDHYDSKTFLDGRGAFYLKGKIKGEYLLTMSADTREQSANSLFSNFGAKDPRSLLLRIDPAKYYPVYGDDSTIVDNAPTQGKFYVRLEKGESHVMWGNFQTRWTGTELTQYNRGLYGANAVWKSEETTSLGEKQTTVNVFAAEPGTLASREEFRGTGGSLYYLKHQDLTIGSERLWVEVRDRDSGMVLERVALIPGQDYEVNYIQGRVLLQKPLSSVADTASIFRTGSLSGNPVYLVSTYEYVPGFTKMGGNTGGLRASHWFGDFLQLGLTGYRQGQDQGFQRLYGVDAIMRFKPGTYVKAEVARSDGAGVGESVSVLGGLDNTSLSGPTIIGTGQRADARRFEAAADLAELWDGSKGRVGGYWLDREKGFSAPGQITLDGRVKQYGVNGTVAVTDSVDVMVKADSRKAESQDYNAAEGAVKFKVTPEVAVSVGAREDKRDVRTANASALLSQDGKRTDAIARVDLKPLVEDADGGAPKPADWDAYGYAQRTLSTSGTRSENNRAGVGGGIQATDRVKIGAEVSGGDGGTGGKLVGDYRIDDRSNAYLGYGMETERPDLTYRGRFGSMYGGSRVRLNEQVSLFNESRMTNGSGPESLTHAFGVDIAPNDQFTYGVKLETGKISDPFAGDFKRQGIGINAGYRFEQTRLSGALEYRNEEGTVNRKTWLLRTALGHQVDPAWRLLGRVNASVSHATAGSFYDGRFVELMAGTAYRPVDNDRWNTLFKYSYTQDIPSPWQVNAYNQTVDYAQRSHVLSVDTIYDVVPWMSLGLKYGVRAGELRQTKVAGDWFSSQAQLAVIRADFHWIHQWDLVVEGRRLWAKEAKDAKSGILLAAYRHIDQHVKAGIGYNFTDFSDNLTDLSYRNHGWFFNVIGKF